MRPKFIFSSRKTRQARDPKNIRKKKKKFPRIVHEVIKASDIVLIVIDARFTKEMFEKELDEELKEKGKKVIYVINKVDLLNKKIGKEKLKEIKNYSLTSCQKKKGIKNLRDKIKIIAKKIDGKEKISVGVIGYPNTGKSSVINRLIGKASAKTGNMPGFTKGLQKLKLSKKIILLDSPGVIPMEKYSTDLQEKINYHTAINVRHYSKTKNPELVISEMMKKMPNVLQEYYGIKKNDPEEFLEELGKRLNIFKKKGIVDEDKTARRILKDWQEGRIKS